MFAKLVFVLILSVLTISVNADLFDTAEALHADLAHAVEVSLNESLPELHFLVIELHALANSASVNGQIQVREKINTIQTQIENLRQEAEDLGLDLSVVDACIESYKFEIDNLSQIVNQEIDLCLNASVNDAIDLLNRSISDILTTQNIVESLKLSIDQCRLLPDNTQCILSVIESIAVEIVDLPARIKEDTQQVKDVMRALEALFPSCTDDRIGVVDSIGGDIVSQIRSCSGLTKIL